MRVYEAGSNPKGGLGALACGSPSTAGECPCKRRPAGRLGFAFPDGADAGDQGDQGDQGGSGSTRAAAGGFDWHLLALAILAAIAIYALWPKPDRERRNVERRDAKDAYERKLRQIDGGGKKKKGGKK